MVLCSRDTYIFVYVELNFLEDNLCVHLIDQMINVHLIDQMINVHLIDQKKKKKKEGTVHMQKVMNTMLLNGCYLSTSL